MEYVLHSKVTSYYHTLWPAYTFDTILCRILIYTDTCQCLNFETDSITCKLNCTASIQQVQAVFVSLGKTWTSGLINEIFVLVLSLCCVCLWHWMRGNLWIQIDQFFQRYNPSLVHCSSCVLLYNILTKCEEEATLD